MPELRKMTAVAMRSVVCAGLSALAAGCASTSAGVSYSSPPPAGLNAAGAPQIVANAALPVDSGRAPLALRAAAVLQALDWPLVSADSATGVLVSDWQYFEPMMPGLPSTVCGRGIALRVLVRPLAGRPGALLTEEIGYSPGVDGTRATGYARMIFRELREQIARAADPAPDWAPPAGEGWVSLTKNLREGDFRVCGAVGGVIQGRAPGGRG